AALAVIEEDRAGGAGNRRLDVRVTEDDGRRLAAEFERYLLKVAGRGFDNELADCGRSGERDLVDIVVGRQRGTSRLAVTGEDVDDAVRKPGFLDQFAEAECAQRRLLRDFQ